MKSNIAVRLYRRIIFPHSKGEFLQSLAAPKAEILDVGCGNNSPSHVKSILPDCIYTGIDVSDYNQTKPNVADSYILTSEECFAESISQMSNRFDAVMSSHNLEHCNQREETLLAMLRSIKLGGRLYLSCPSESSVNFPSRGGTLNYYDDKTHKDLPPSYTWLLETLKANGMRVIYSTPAHKPFIPHLIGWLKEPISRRKNKTDYYTWAYYGFQTIIWAEKVG